MGVVVDNFFFHKKKADISALPLFRQSYVVNQNRNETHQTGNQEGHNEDDGHHLHEQGKFRFDEEADDERGADSCDLKVLENPFAKASHVCVLSFEWFVLV